MENKIILSYKKSSRILTTMLLLIIIFGDMLFLMQLLSNINKFRFIDFLAIISSLLLTIWFILLFLDSWKIVKANKEKIETELFFLRLNSACWHDIIGINESRTSLYNNFEQGRIIILLNKQGKTIRISKKYKNFNLFYKNYKEWKMYLG